MTKGIYKITNEKTGETYIGQTNNLYFREKQHMEDLASGTHHNRGMQQDYNNGDKFTFEVLEEVYGTRQDLHDLEKEYINKYNSFYAGYNQTPGGEYDKYKGRYEYGGGRKYSHKKQKTYNHITPKKDYQNSADTFESFVCIFGLIIGISVYFLFYSTGITALEILGVFMGPFAGLSIIGFIFSIYDEKKKTQPVGNLKTCPKCKNETGDHAMKCPWCGYSFKDFFNEKTYTKKSEPNKTIPTKDISTKTKPKKSKPTKKCPNCGFETQIISERCSYCGYIYNKSHK